MSPNHYIDAPAFTALFGDPVANRGEIGRLILTLCEHVAGRLVWEDADDRADAVADAALYCVRKLDRFDATRPGANAFTYFTSVAFNQLRKTLVAASRHRARYVRTTDYADPYRDRHEAADAT